VIIAGAGGAAHLPGMAAAKTSLPVLGVPVQSQALSGLDSLLSIVQMPEGHSRRHARHRPFGRCECGAARRFDPESQARGHPAARSRNSAARRPKAS
jgi:hypothetical protein